MVFTLVVNLLPLASLDFQSRWFDVLELAGCEDLDCFGSGRCSRPELPGELILWKR